MARRRQFIDKDVYEEAKARIHHVYDIFDSIVVSFSGGKDSLALLHVTHEVAVERGVEHVDVVFRDEELLNDSIIEFVNHYRTEVPWCRMRWLSVPLLSHKYVLGHVFSYTQWDPARQWVRPMPEWAERAEDLGLDPATPLTQYETDDIIARPYKGRVAIMLGIRAAESITRYRSCVNKLNENYINASPCKRARLVKPIFDWQENDVFKLFYDKGIPYCALYDAQAMAGAKLRVATPLTTEGAKVFESNRRIDPDFYDRLIEVFPEMLTQERYYGELDREALIRRYGQSLDGVEAWILENLTDERLLAKALNELRGVRVRDGNRPGSYPPEYVLKAFMGGDYKKVIQPVVRSKV